MEDILDAWAIPIAKPHSIRTKKKIIIMLAVNAEIRSMTIAISKAILHSRFIFCLSIFIDIRKPAVAVENVPIATAHPAEKDVISA